jgi:hypothetical protein
MHPSTHSYTQALGRELYNLRIGQRLYVPRDAVHGLIAFSKKDGMRWGQVVSFDRAKLKYLCLSYLIHKPILILVISPLVHVLPRMCSPRLLIAFGRAKILLLPKEIYGDKAISEEDLNEVHNVKEGNIKREYEEWKAKEISLLPSLLAVVPLKKGVVVPEKSVTKLSSPHLHRFVEKISMFATPLRLQWWQGTFACGSSRLRSQTASVNVPMQTIPLVVERSPRRSGFSESVKSYRLRRTSLNKA